MNEMEESGQFQFIALNYNTNNSENLNFVEVYEKRHRGIGVFNVFDIASFRFRSKDDIFSIDWLCCQPSRGKPFKEVVNDCAIFFFEAARPKDEI